MFRYMVETPHTAEECHRLIEQIHAMGYLHNFDWGCKVGVHCGWAIIEAENQVQAQMAVPPLVRQKARVIELVKFNLDQEEKLHGR